jgi:hypothetical protein
MITSLLARVLVLLRESVTHLSIRFDRSDPDLSLPVDESDTVTFDLVSVSTSHRRLD